jgi:hypothetical protein
MSEFKMPTEVVELPSKGLLYPEGHPLSEGKIEMKYMTAKEEDILTNSNYLKQGIAIDKLLQSMITTKFDYNDLLVGDKDSLLLAARILGYGKDYEFAYYKDGVEKQGVVDLTTLKEKEIDTSLFKKGVNEFSYTFPHSKNEITFKFLTHGDEKKIDAEIKGLKKLDINASYDLTTRLKFMITSVEGKRERKDIWEFVDKYLIAKDSREFRKHYASLQPGVEMKFTPEDGEEAIDLPIGVSFFWPDSTI